MIPLLGSIRQIEAVAVSGGADSMAVLSFLRNGRHAPIVLHFDHGTAHGADARRFVEDYCQSQGLTYQCAKVSRQKDSKESWEEYWRNERYAFFNSLPYTIATCHHLNDLAETWILGFMHGRPRLTPYRNKNVIRPFLFTPQAELHRWLKRFNVPHIEDPSNQDVHHPRNRIRHNILPEMLEVNPGFLEMVRRQAKMVDSCNPQDDGRI